ncbi:MAG TPA: nucleoside triphosphate pyrophosphohydrolase [Gammaproteobacteria bacterium]|nr:nucleoside triphosphate pyrophosphohydrolase [Gammaproteobacteria bacterium]
MSAGGRGIGSLLAIMARLRDPEEGCPWDLAQDFRSIVPHTLEEAYEVADAVESGDLRHLRDELGDLLFQVLFLSRLAEELSLFDFDAVVAALTGKLVRRHPHVFGDARVADAGEQRRSWEHIKAQERVRDSGAGASELDGVPAALPALSRAAKVGRRAGRVGFDWDDAEGALDKVEEELLELKEALEQTPDVDEVEEELGDLLFSLTNLSRHLEIDPEAALRRATRKFERRFRHVEALLRERGLRPAREHRDEMERYWRQAKGGDGEEPGSAEDDGRQ